MRKTLAAIGLLAIGLLIAGFGWWRLTREVPVTMVHPGVPPAHWQTYVQGLQGSAPSSGGPMVPLMRAWKALNRAEVAAMLNKQPPTEDAAYRRALSAFELAAVAYEQERGGHALMQVGRWEGLRLIEAIRDLLKYAKHRGAPAETLLAAKADPVQVYIAVGGGFVYYAQRAKLVEAGVLVEARLPMLQALFMEHWQGLLRQRRPLDAQVKPRETEWLMRWRLEFHQNAPVEARLAAAHALDSLEDYPAQLNAGVVLYQAKRYAEALDRFRRSKARLAPVYARMARRARP
jgi:tetratricopeptide (TPR) repeat protein